LEKRFTSANNVGEHILFFGNKCLELLETIKPQGYPCLTLASEITARLIEAGRITNGKSAVENLSQNMKTLESIKMNLKSQDSSTVLRISVDMVLKMIETVTLSVSSIPNVLADVSASSDAILT
jgi:hypothetical protein